MRGPTASFSKTIGGRGKNVSRNATIHKYKMSIHGNHCWPYPLHEPPTPSSTECLPHQHVDRWLACLQSTPLLQYQQQPPLAPCHIALAIHPKDHHPMQQKIWHFIPFLGRPRSSFTGIKISQDSQHPPWSPATLWLWNSQQTMACLFLTLPEALRFTHFISLPPSPLYLESYCCHVLSFFLFTLSLSSSAALYPKSVTPQCLATFQLF